MTDVSLRLIVLKSMDVDEAVGFYSSLGLVFTEEQHGKGPIHYSAPLGDAIIEIYPLPRGQAVDTSTRLGFEIDNPDNVVEQIDRVGGRVLKSGRDTAWGHVAIVADPDGRTVELYRAQ